MPPGARSQRVVAMADPDGVGPTPPSGRVDPPAWLAEAVRQIRAIDYELHAGLRIIANAEIGPEQWGEFAAAFIGAQAKRSRLMARVLSFLAELNKDTLINIQSDEKGSG